MALFIYIILVIAFFAVANLGEIRYYYFLLKVKRLARKSRKELTKLNKCKEELRTTQATTKKMKSGSKYVT